MNSAIKFTDGSNYDVNIIFIHTTFNKLSAKDKVYLMDNHRLSSDMRVQIGKGGLNAESEIRITVCIVTHGQGNSFTSERFGYAICSLSQTFNKTKGRRNSLTDAINDLPREYRTMVWEKYFEWESIPEMQKKIARLDTLAEKILKSVEAFDMVAYNETVRPQVLAGIISVLDNSGID